MLDIHPGFFYLFAGISIAFSLMVVLKKNPVNSAFSLVLVFFAFAGIYALLDAHLIATLQVLVYAGAIMVLFIFVIMLLNADTPSLDLRHTPLYIKIGSGALILAFAASVIAVFKNHAPLVGPGKYSHDFVQMAGGNTQVISELMFSEYILPFELTSVLLLGGIVGAVAIAKRDIKRDAKNIKKGPK